MPKYRREYLLRRECTHCGMEYVTPMDQAGNISGWCEQCHTLKCPRCLEKTCVAKRHSVWDVATYEKWADMYPNLFGEEW